MDTITSNKAKDFLETLVEYVNTKSEPIVIDNEKGYKMLAVPYQEDILEAVLNLLHKPNNTTENTEKVGLKNISTTTIFEHPQQNSVATVTNQVKKTQEEIDLDEIRKMSLRCYF